MVIAKGHEGLIVDLGLKRDGVVPRSDLEKMPDAGAGLKVGTEIAVMVVDPIDGEGNLTVSLAQARESGDWLRAQKLMETGEVIEASPSGCNRGGLIVPFGRLRGFIPASHLTELARDLDEEARVEFLKRFVGKALPCRVIEVDPRRQRLVLSERKAIRTWRVQQKANVIGRLREGEVRKGTVTSVREFGVFVDIGGADGLVHISELAWHRVEDPGELCRIGDEIEVMVVRLDPQANRIGLSRKRLLPSPWQSAAEQVKPQQVLPGNITRLSGRWAGVRLGCGLEGMAAIPPSVLEVQPGDRVYVEVMSFEPSNERLELKWVDPREVPPRELLGRDLQEKEVTTA
jgi:small subunit ribosomal protein S1